MNDYGDILSNWSGSLDGVWDVNSIKKWFRRVNVGISEKFID